MREQVRFASAVSRSLGLGIAAALCVLQALGCASAGGPVRTVQRKAANVLLPPAEEAQLGKQMEQEVQRQFRSVSDPVLQDYVKRLGNIVAAVATDKPQGITFDFTLLDDPRTINAFAIPGGHIYVFSGLFRAVDSEAELVSVISHEVAHVTQRHVAQRLVTTVGLDLVTQIALGQAAGPLGQLVGNIAEQGYLLKYSRDQEREADRVGLGYLIRVGYDPYAFVRFFEQLEQMSHGKSSPAFLSSHPAPKERINNMRKLIAQYGQVPTAEHRLRLEQMQARLGAEGNPPR